MLKGNAESLYFSLFVIYLFPSPSLDLKLVVLKHIYMTLMTLQLEREGMFISKVNSASFSIAFKSASFSHFWLQCLKARFNIRDLWLYCHSINASGH